MGILYDATTYYRDGELADFWAVNSVGTIIGTIYNRQNKNIERNSLILPSSSFHFDYDIVLDQVSSAQTLATETEEWDTSFCGAEIIYLSSRPDFMFSFATSLTDNNNIWTQEAYSGCLPCALIGQ